MRRLSLPAALIAAALGVGPAYAQPTDVETAYFDLVFGYCMERYLGQSLRDDPADPESWNQAANWTGSEDSMNADPDAVDLRVSVLDGGELLVDLKNAEICWTQASGVDAATLSARIRLAILDDPNHGVVLDEAVERAPDSRIVSRLTTYGLVEWPGDGVPVFFVREVVEPPTSVVTVQVLKGERGQ